MQSTGIAPAVRRVGVMLTLAVCLLPAAPAAAAPGEASASARLLIPSAGWHGRPVRDPQPGARTTPAAARPPRGWEAGPVALGTGTHRATGSQRVRELQWRLKALGYRPGPIDGIFGVRTRAAVAWFQVKHGFRVDGRANLAVVRHLRGRTTPDRGGEQRSAEPRIEPAAPAPAPTPVVAATADTPSAWWIALLVALAFAVGFAAVALLQRRRGPEPSRALGYVRVAGAQRIEPHATSLETHCADHGLVLAGLVTDEDADERDRPGLEYALRQLRTGEADCLVVGRLGHLTRSAAELNELLDVMSERETPLVVLNADPASRGSTRFATSTPAGERR